MAIAVSIHTSDCEPDDAERRSAHVTASGACRVAVVSLSGGMMDIGWAQRLMSPVRGVADRFVSTADEFGAATSRFIAELRRELTEHERRQRLWCSAAFLLLEAAPTCLRTARIGGLRLWRAAPGGAGPVGKEDVLALPFGGPASITVAQLIPDVHWMVSAGSGWELKDEAADAERQASQVRIEQVARNQPLCLAVLTHPFWTAIPESELASLLDPRDLEPVLRQRVDAARKEGKQALAAVVRIP
ncbi:MAG TPA: hypothetical protein PKI03_03345 [Pseudomonadota bacterium]|nr:hypothetical protein [Pseudomonadota bacterium]